MDERMTLCNMSIEGGARVGYVNPDETTFAYLRGRPVRAGRRGLRRALPPGGDRIASDPDAAYDDEVSLDGAALEPMVTWGINPGQSVGVDERVPVAGRRRRRRARRRATTRSSSWASRPGRRSPARRVDVAFIGSCTNGRLSDLREAARDRARAARWRRTCAALVVPGSQPVARGGRARRAARGLPRGRLRVARGRLLDVPRR